MSVSRTVYILGAGASKDYEGSKTGKRMPLAREFFPTFSSLDISWQWECRIGEIINYVRDYRGISADKFSLFEEDIEAFFTEIDEHLRVMAEGVFPRRRGDTEAWGEFLAVSKAYDQLLLLIAHVINEIQNGVTCTHYAELGRKLEQGSVVITLNWDCLLDRALYESGGWCPDDGYDLDFVRILEDSWRAPEDHRSQFKLLKLHGSTNWLVNYTSRDPETGQRVIFNPDRSPLGACCFVSARAPYRAYRSRFRYGYSPFSYFFPPDSPVDGVPLIPLLIPPVLRKEYDEWKGIYDIVWKAAETAIRQARTILIAGYRFPPTDIRPLRLLQVALGNGAVVEVVNPTDADTICNRLKRVIPVKVKYVPHRCTFREYLSSL